MSANAKFSETFQHEGQEFIMSIYDDDFGGAPWENEDGHGYVTDWTRRAKRPGERVLCRDGRYCRYYDFQDAVLKARREGWGFHGMDKRIMTAGEIAARAAEEDLQRLRRWCDGDWSYVGIAVSLAGHGMGDHRASLWGIESDDDYGIRQAATELADEVLRGVEKCIAMGAPV